MKQILITGKNSYVGNSLEKWIKQWPEKYQIHKISLRDDKWRKEDFSKFDVIVHVAGIVHQKETKENEQDYYRVNRDLAIELARKAKEEGVPHFIFLSTMSVYGLETGVITKDTPLNPKTHYGKSKLEAERAIERLSSDTFHVAIVRPPMIYGKNCPGNYQRLRWLALKTPIFPDIENKRSMIYIDNLSEFLKNVIDQIGEGLFCPQNKEYVNTSNLVQQIAVNNKKKIYLTKIFNPILKFLKLDVVNKVFGTLIYDGGDKIDVQISFNESIKKTEGSMNQCQK